MQQAKQGFLDHRCRRRSGQVKRTWHCIGAVAKVEAAGRAAVLFPQQQRGSQRDIRRATAIVIEAVGKGIKASRKLLPKRRGLGRGVGRQRSGEASGLWRPLSQRQERALAVEQRSAQGDQVVLLSAAEPGPSAQLGKARFDEGQGRQRQALVILAERRCRWTRRGKGQIARTHRRWQRSQPAVVFRLVFWLEEAAAIRRHRKRSAREADPQRQIELRGLAASGQGHDQHIAAPIEHAAGWRRGGDRKLAGLTHRDWGRAGVAEHDLVRPQRCAGRVIGEQRPHLRP